MDVSSQGAIRFQGIWGQGKISAYQMRGGAGFPHLAHPIPVPQPYPCYQGEQGRCSQLPSGRWRMRDVYHGHEVSSAACCHTPGLSKPTREPCFIPRP